MAGSSDTDEGIPDAEPRASSELSMLQRLAQLAADHFAAHGLLLASCMEAHDSCCARRQRRRKSPSVQSRIPKMNKRTQQRVSLLGSDTSTSSGEDDHDCASDELVSKRFYEEYRRVKELQHQNGCKPNKQVIL